MPPGFGSQLPGVARVVPEEEVRMRCRVCGRDAPEGVFCTMCGADQDARIAPKGGNPARQNRFAAQPNEPVIQPALLTTLLPHLDRDEVNEFRLGLFAGGAIVVALYLAGFISAAILTSAFLVPVLYAMYLYEVRTYRDAPAAIFGATLGAGAVIGVIATLILNLARSPLPTAELSPVDVVVYLPGLLVAGIVIPAIQEVVKPIPALLLRHRPKFAETIDGLVFGVAAGLGFSLGQSLVQFAGVIGSLGLRAEPANWIFPLVSTGLLLPVLHGSSTGAITAAVWRFGQKRGGRLEVGGIAAAFASQLAFPIGSQLLSAAGAAQLIVLLWQALVVGLLIVYVRSLLHAALIDEARDFSTRRVTCPNCHHAVTAANFCPSCGMAMAATTSRRHESTTQAPNSPAGQAS